MYYNVLMTVIIPFNSLLHFDKFGQFGDNNTATKSKLFMNILFL